MKGLSPPPATHSFVELAVSSSCFAANFGAIRLRSPSPQQLEAAADFILAGASVVSLELSELTFSGLPWGSSNLRRLSSEELRSRKVHADALLRGLIRVLVEGERVGVNLLKMKQVYTNDEEAKQIFANLPATLTTFGFSRSPIGQASVDYLAKSIYSRLTQLSDLDISANKIQMWQAGTLAIALSKRTELRRLNLKYNSFGPQLRQHMSVDESGVQRLDTILCGCRSLRHLNLGCTGVGGFAHILVKAHIKDALPLESLRLFSNSIGVDLITLLAPGSMPKLLYLDLDGNQLVAKVSLALAKFLRTSNLQVLRLKSCMLYDTGVRNVAEALTSSKLKMLDLSANHMGESGAKGLHNALVLNPPLEELRLTDNDFLEAGAKTIGESLQKGNRMLKVLIMNKNGITENGAFYIWEAISSPACAIRVLDLAENMISNNGIELMFNALSKTGLALTTLCLDNNKLAKGHFGSEALAKMLATNRALSDLSLNTIELGREGIRMLAEALGRSHTLRRLSISGTGAGKRGAGPIAQALAKNRSLRELIMAHNKLGEEGAQQLAPGIMQNCGLIVLDLEGNQLEAVGCREIIDAAVKNPTLAELNLKSNNLAIATVYEAIDLRPALYIHH